MKQSSLTSVAATLITDFSSAVLEAEKADAANLALMEQSIELAMGNYDAAQAAIDEKRSLAARLVAESLDMERLAREQLQEDMRAARAAFSKAGSEKLANVKGLRLIAGKKVA